MFGRRSLQQFLTPIASLGNIFIAVGLLGQHCMVTVAPALTETATEPHEFQLSSSSLSSSSIEPDTFFHEEDTITEQKLNGECNTQSAWSQLAYPFATCGLGSDAPDLKHVPYGSITVHSAIPSNAASLTSPNSLLEKLSLNCKLNIRKTLFSKSSAVILAKKLSCDRTKQVSASKASRMYFVPEAELSSSNNDKKDLNFQKDNALECMGMLSTGCQVKLACDSVSMTLNNAGGMTSNQKVMLKPVKANKTQNAVPAWDDFEFGSLLNSTRQLILQRNEEKQLCGTTSIRKNEINTQLFECLSRHQEQAKKSSQLQKHLQLIQAKHVECQIKCKIQDFMKCRLGKHDKRSKIDISNTEIVFPFGIKHSGVHTGFISNSINSEFYEYVSFSKALLSHVKESVDFDATSSSTEEDTDSEEIALNRICHSSPEIQNQLNCTSSVCRVSEVVQTKDPQDLLVEGVTSAKVVLPWNCRTFPLRDEETKHLTHPKVAVSDKVGPQLLTRCDSALSGNSSTNQSPSATGSLDRLPSTGHTVTEETEYKHTLGTQQYDEVVLINLRFI